MLTLASLVQVKKECFVFGLCPKTKHIPSFLRAKRAKTYSKLISMIYLELYTFVQTNKR
jgi:hypothetical protein